MQYSVPTIIINSKKIIIYRNLTWISTLTFTLIQLLWMDSCMEISTKISAATNARQSFQNSSGTMRKIFPWPTHRLTEMRSRQEPAEGNYRNKDSSVFYCSIVWFTCFFCCMTEHSPLPNSFWEQIWWHDEFINYRPGSSKLVNCNSTFKTP